MVNWAALSAGIVDKVFFFYAPKILAGTGSIPFALGAGYQPDERRRVCEVRYAASLRRRFRGGRIVTGPLQHEIRLARSPGDSI